MTTTFAKLQADLSAICTYTISEGDMEISKYSDIDDLLDAILAYSQIKKLTVYQECWTFTLNSHRIQFNYTCLKKHHYIHAVEIIFCHNYDFLNISVKHLRAYGQYFNFASIKYLHTTNRLENEDRLLSMNVQAVYVKNIGIELATIPVICEEYYAVSIIEQMNKPIMFNSVIINSEKDLKYLDKYEKLRVSVSNEYLIPYIVSHPNVRHITTIQSFIPLIASFCGSVSIENNNGTIDITPLLIGNCVKWMLPQWVHVGGAPNIKFDKHAMEQNTSFIKAFYNELDEEIIDQNYYNRKCQRPKSARKV